MSRQRDDRAYPPRGMDRVDAARYIGVGITKFDQLVADRRMPQPMRVDGRVVWDRVKLDIAFSDLAAVDDGENQIDAVLARAASRR